MTIIESGRGATRLLYLQGYARRVSIHCLSHVDTSYQVRVKIFEALKPEITRLTKFIRPLNITSEEWTQTEYE